MTVERKNYYEELIDKMMIEEVISSEQIRVLLRKNKNIKTKRTAILSALEENNSRNTGLFNKIKTLLLSKGDKIDSVEHIKNVVKMLRDYVDYGDVEKKKFGEVMTPISLVEEMLDTLPNEVWSNPNLKWLDNSAGVGIFPAVIVERLMAGLVSYYPDDEERYGHIMENMIYVAELQPKNMFLYLCAFDPEDKYSLNIYQGSYLDNGFDEHMSEVYGVDQWNIVVMNPPYQEQKEGFKKTQPLWHKFVQKSIETSLVEGGYMVTVHPDSWRTTGRGFKETKKLLSSKEMLYLEVHNIKDGLKTFGAETTYDFYCLRNTNNNNFLTKIKFMDGTSKMLNISKLDFIPNGMFKMFQNLFPKNGEEKVDFVSDSTYHTQRTTQMSKTQDNHFKYPCIYMTRKDGSLSLWYSKTNTKHFNISKLVWTNGRSSTPIIDSNGEYGITQFAYSIVDDVETLHKIKRAMENPIFLKLMYYSNGNTGHKYNHRIIAMFRKDFWRDFI